MAIVLVLSGVDASAQSAADKAKASEHVKQAAAYFQVKAWDAAINEYESAYALLPRPGLLFNIGLCHEELGHKQQAADHYRRYLAAAPEGGAATEARARSLKLERAIEEEASAAAEARKKTEAEGERRRRILEHVRKGRVAVSQRRYAEAIREYRAAHSLSGDVELLYEIATVFDEQGQSDDAIAQYEAYVAVAPTTDNGIRGRKRVRTLRATEAERDRLSEKAAKPGRKWRPWSVGAKAGIVLSKQGFFTESGPECDSGSLQTSAPQLSLSGSYAFSRSFGLQAEVMYSRRIVRSSCNVGGMPEKLEADISYVFVPVFARLTRVGEDFGVAVYGGPVVGLSQGSENFSAPGISIEESSTVFGVAVGVEGGIGVGAGRLILDARFEGNNQTTRVVGLASDFEYSSEAGLSLMLGYVY